ncbi:glycine cleavage system protein GcvH [Candidatus Poribacteria bacterium]|nr:glycine cleavage system protein GcvH [Candidatus Poribacteria bacterium]MYK95563.1 glycine cleavage system protein GcvH [Candidatus Poribacteria bacterium]
MILQELKYNESHEWARQEGDIVTIGISDYAQSEIQDIVYVELPEVGTELTQKTEFGVIESVKAAFDLYAPVSGEVIEVNESLLDAPEQVNESPYDDGWFLKIRITNPDELNELLDADSYQAHIEAEHA